MFSLLRKWDDDNPSISYLISMALDVWIVPVLLPSAPDEGNGYLKLFSVEQVLQLSKPT